MTKRSITHAEKAERFWTNVQKSDGCWLWTAALNQFGYGTTSAFYVRGGSGWSTLAHRVAYRLSVGEIPAGLTLDHLCRVRNCVRPDHLRPCTITENLKAKPIRAKKIQDRRQRFPADPNRPRSVRRLPKSYLNPVAARVIRHLYARGVSGVRLALAHRVSAPAISRIATGKAWLRDYEVIAS